MAANVVVDAGFIVAFLNRRDRFSRWAITEASRRTPPWLTCEAALSEASHVLGPRGGTPLDSLLRRRMVRVAFDFDAHVESVVTLKEKYAGVPMSLADACLVRMTELMSDVTLLTTDSDFRVYRRHSRQVIPCVMPI